MYAKLKILFDKSKWKNKHFGKVPEYAPDIRYSWREDEIEFAELFLKNENVLTETTAAVDRELYLGQDKNGHWMLCVTERTRTDYDPKKIAEGMTTLMDASRFFQKFVEASKGPDSPK